MISLSDVTLMRGTRVLMEHATAALYDGHKIGIIGRNGCGKSSLFAAIQGELAPELGTLAVPKGLRIAAVAQQTPALTEAALDYVIDGDKELRALQRQQEEAMAAGDGEKIALIEDKLGIVGAWTVKARAENLLDGLGFSKDEMSRPVKEFSGGWRMRLNLAQALIARSDLLLLDEPTNHLDLDTIMFLEGYLKAYQGTLLCISHDRDFLDSFCSAILHFESGTVVLYKGNYSAYERLRAERIKAEKAARRKEEATLAHLQAFVDRFRYKATKAKQAQSMLKAIDRIKLTAVTQEESPFSFTFPEPDRTVAVLASFHQVTAGYGTEAILHDINVQLLAGDRIGLLGRNGQGKSTFIKTLAGIIPPLQGTVTLGKDIKLGYFAQQELEELNLERSALEHLQKLDPKASERELRSFLGGFAFSGDKALLPAGQLSGGEQARLALAIIAYQKPNLLLLDEPTNHLDLEMREALTVALASYPGALLLVSHDRHLLEAIAEKLWLIDEGKVSEFNGDLNDYQEYLSNKHKRFADSLKEKHAPEGAGPSMSAKAYKSKEDKRAMAQFRASLRPLKLEIEALEKKTAKLEDRIKEIDGILAQGTIYQEDSAKAEALMIERAQCAHELEDTEEQWLDKQSTLEDIIAKHDKESAC